jgi:hypothetical protein
MFTKKELKFAYVLAACLLVVGAVSYAAYTEEEPVEPRRHQIHTSAFGYGISCGDCHHTLSEDEYADAQSCSECHELDEGDEEVPKRADAFHQQCAGCHEDFDAGPRTEECSKCHVK